jgi:hypothetical protein
MILISSKEEVRVSPDALDEPGRSKLNAGGRLDSWKEIAAYLGRSVRSVQRWERAEGLPVLRHQHVKGVTVYAYRHEVDQWREEGRTTLYNAAPATSGDGRVLSEQFCSGKAGGWTRLNRLRLLLHGHIRRRLLAEENVDSGRE